MPKAPRKNTVDSVQPPTKSQRKERLETITAYGTIGAAIAAAAAAITSAWQASISDRTAKQQLRPYISLVLDEAKLKEDMEHLPLYATNVGQTPAYNVQFKIRTSIKRGDTVIRDITPTSNSIPSSMALGNGQRYPVGARMRKIDGSLAKIGEIVESMREEDPSERFVFEGEVKYRDLFKIEHVDYFCYDVGQDGPKMGGIGACPSDPGY